MAGKIHLKMNKTAQNYHSYSFWYSSGDVMSDTVKSIFKYVFNFLNNYYPD